MKKRKQGELIIPVGAPAPVLPVIVSPSLVNFFECVKGHENPAGPGEVVLGCRRKTKSGKECKGLIVKISRTEYYCALPGCEKTVVNQFPGWSALSLSFERDNGSGGASQSRRVENVRFCTDEHASAYLHLKADEVKKW